MRGNTVAINGVLNKKTTKLNSQSAQYEKNKFDIDNFKKPIDKKTCGETLQQGKNHVGGHCNKTKIIWRNIVVIHSVLKNYKAKFSISLI